MEAAVRYEASDGVGVVTLNRPSAHNGMTPELLDAFDAALASARDDAALRCLVVTGRGSSFCRGADLKVALQRGPASALPHERSFAMYEPFLSLLDLPVPVVGAIGGHAVGGGFGLALLCDIRIVAESAKLGANFVRLGIHAGLGISHLLPRAIGGSRAAEMLFTGKLIRGEEAARIGLASAAYPTEDVLPRSLELAREIAKGAPLAVRSMKRSLLGGLAGEVRRAAREEALLQAETLATSDAAEGIRALLEKRDPIFVGR